MKILKAIVRRFRASIYFFLILIGMTCTVQAGNIGDALAGEKPVIDVRLRYENVGQENVLKDADALTVRTRLGYETPDFNDFKAYIEMENNTDLMDDYNSTRNRKAQYSVVADPDESELNQFFLSYNGFPNTQIKLGRQRIKLDNDRFIGNVGWRQLEQTFDAAIIHNTTIPDTIVSYGFINEIIDIFSKHVDINAHIFNVNYKGWSAGTLTGYGYFLDFNNAPTTSQKTFGLRFSGSKQLDFIKILYTAEFAKQDEYKDSNNSIDSEYIFLEIGADVSFLTAKLGYEQLGEDAFSGFETPLATKHAFNGWADQFLGTPAAGLRDIYFLLSGKIHGINLTCVYHDFQSDLGSIGYGTELDFLAVKKFGKSYSIGAKYADYNADNFSVDTEKLWLWTQIKF